MVLLDDNFATIVSAVEEGRTIYDNVRRFIKYLLASNTGELIVLLAVQLINGMTIPLTTLQILWMNLVTDGVPALALGVEQSEKGVMKRKPYAPDERPVWAGLGPSHSPGGFAFGQRRLGAGVLGMVKRFACCQRRTCLEYNGFHVSDHRSDGPCARSAFSS